MSAPPALRSRHAHGVRVLAIALALVAGTFAAAPPASAAVGVPVDYVGHTYASTTSAPSADKPQSKLWFHDGSWWALMAGAGSSTTYIHQLMPDHTWRNTGAVVDTRANATGDALWSSRDSRLYVANRATGSNLQVDTFAYDAAADTWSVVRTATVNSGGGSESATIDQDSTGRLWVTYTRAQRLWVAASDASRTTWGAPFNPPGDTLVGTDDLSALIAFGTSVGVLYSDQESGGFHFAIHADSAAPTAGWSIENISSIPGIDSNFLADDHINLKQLVGDGGRIFAAVKTSANDGTAPSTAPLNLVLQRSADGQWTSAVTGTVGDNHTRPLIMIDSQSQTLYWFATGSTTGGSIWYKTAPLSNIKAFENDKTQGKVFIDANPFKVNNASGSKDPVNGSTGLVVLASGQDVKQYVHGEMALATGGMFDGGGQEPVDPAPIVTSTSPAANATGVAVGANVTATFSEAVQGVSGTTFTLASSAGTAVPATVTYNATTKTATLDPGASLAAGTTYTATLTGGATAIRDSANQPLTSGGWSFTTATATTDGTAPTVTARAPAVNATKVAVSANVTATFSEAVQGVDSTTFAVTDPNGAVVPAVVSRDGTTNRWILNPNANLATDTRYTVTLTGGSTAIRDLAGNALTSTSWQFLTGPAPTVSTRTPAAGATGVSKTANITATFSEAVQGVSTTTFTLKNTATGALVTATVTKNATTNQWILDPGVTLTANTKYTVTVTGGTTAVRDLAGNPLTTTTWAFTTGA